MIRSEFETGWETLCGRWRFGEADREVLWRRIQPYPYAVFAEIIDDLLATWERPRAPALSVVIRRATGLVRARRATQRVPCDQCRGEGWIFFIARLKDDRSLGGGECRFELASIRDYMDYPAIPAEELRGGWWYRGAVACDCENAMQRRGRAPTWENDLRQRAISARDEFEANVLSATQPNASTTAPKPRFVSTPVKSQSKAELDRESESKMAEEFEKELQREPAHDGEPVGLQLPQEDEHDDEDLPF